MEGNKFGYKGKRWQRTLHITQEVKILSDENTRISFGS